jgi:hypothetical protein
MNAGTCWGKNTIDPRGRGVERPRKATLPFIFYVTFRVKTSNSLVILIVSTYSFIPENILIVSE